jgi:hypothetical protein
LISCESQDTKKACHSERSEASSLEHLADLDVLGVRVWEQSASGNEHRIETTGLTQGVYFLKIKTKQGEFMRKIMLR